MSPKTILSVTIVLIAASQFAVTTLFGFLRAGPAAAAALLSALAASPFIYKWLAVELKSRRMAEEDLQRDNDILGILREIIRISSKPVPLEEIFKRVIDRLISVPWLALESKAAVFLVQSDGKTLALKAHRGIPSPLAAKCGNVAFGQCLCGKAALSGKTEFAGSLDDRHEITHEGMTPHGHYCVPIKSGEKILGVITLYLRPHHLRSEKEISFLEDVAGLLAGITEYRQTEEMLGRLKDKQLSLIFENVSDLIAIVDMEGKRLYNNPAYKKVLGDPEFLKGTDSFSEIHPEDRERVRRIFQKTVKTGIGERTEYRFVLSDKSIRNIESMGNIILDENGAPSQMVIVSRDITERKRLEQQLLQAQKMDALGKLAGGVAHDFNNLITAIIGYSEFLIEKFKNDEQTRGDLEEIKKAAERGSSLTRQLLAFSRKQVLSPKTLDINAIITNLKKMLMRLIGENIELVTSLENSLALAKVDPGQIEQVLVNLAVNARDAMPKGGKLTIETSNVTLEENYTSENSELRPGKYVMISVGDTGIGMDRDVQSRVFEPFFTTKRPGMGTGLGLSTVYGIVRQSGGSISLYSRPSRGTIFKIYIPAAEGSADSAGAQDSYKPEKRGAETILLVEDDCVVRNLTRRMLQENGYIVLEASSEEEAVSVSQKHGGTVHLILTDILMRGADGFELAKNISKARPGIKTVYMSGYMETSVVNPGMLSGETPFIQKPFTSDMLLKTIRKTLDSPEKQR